MAYNDLNCSEDRANTGLANCLENLGADVRLIWTTESFEFASEADAKDITKWEAAINAKYMSPFPTFDEIEPNEEDDVETETGLGVSKFVREGKDGATGRFELALCNLAKLRTYNKSLGRAFAITENGMVRGTSPDGVVFKGFKLSKFFTSKMKGSDGSTVRWVELKYQFKNSNELGDYPAVPALTWDPLELAGIIDVDLSISGTPTSGELIVKVARDCDAEAVTGLVEADFTLVNDESATQLPATSFTDNGDGTFTFTFTDAAVLSADDYIVNLKSPSTQTTGGYESSAEATFTIGA